MEGAATAVVAAAVEHVPVAVAVVSPVVPVVAADPVPVAVVAPRVPSDAPVAVRFVAGSRSAPSARNLSRCRHRR